MSDRKLVSSRLEKVPQVRQLLERIEHLERLVEHQEMILDDADLLKFSYDTFEEAYPLPEELDAYQVALKCSFEDDDQGGAQ